MRPISQCRGATATDGDLERFCEKCERLAVHPRDPAIVYSITVKRGTDGRLTRVCDEFVPFHVGTVRSSVPAVLRKKQQRVNRRRLAAFVLGGSVLLMVLVLRTCAEPAEMTVAHAQPIQQVSEPGTLALFGGAVAALMVVGWAAR